MEIASLRLRRLTSLSFRSLGMVAAVWSAASCHAPIDTARQAPPKATLGDDMYGVFCDRVGASALTEDTAGASYHSVCHFDAQGQYAAKVDESLLPPPTDDKSKEARRLSIAKLEAMVAHRDELIRALNTVFPPDVELDDVTKPGQKIKLNDAFLDFTQSIVPLYDTNPYEKQGEPLLPSSTRSMSRLFDALAHSDAATDALKHIWGRRGYRPFPYGLGAVRSALGYTGLRAFTKASLHALAPDGPAIPELNQLFTVGKQELLTAKPTTSMLAPLVVDPTTHQPNRPRSTIEVASAIFLNEDSAFAQTDSDPPRLIAKRDRRGFVITSLKAPFVDSDGDGLADIDSSGRFVDASNKPLSIALPFAIPNEAKGDTAGLYTTLDTSRTAIGAVSRHLAPLVDATVVGSGPDAWKGEHETLMYALGGAYVLYGGREQAQYDYANDKIVPAGQSCDGCVTYNRFKSEESPLPDLIHAAGQLLADPDSDAILESLLDLVENHPDTVARLLGAALKIRQVSLDHDALAAQGKEPFASMPYETPIWDEFAALVSDISKKPGLLAGLLNGLASDEVVKPQGTSQHMGETVAAFLTNRDAFQYDVNNLNGPPVNLTEGAPSTAAPKFPVDQNKPKMGDNRSILQRTLQMIHDANGGPACNKDGAKVNVNVGGIKLTWPIGSSYNKCELFRFDNLGTFYLDSILPANHPKRSKLVLQDATLNALMNFLNNFVSADKVFADSSGISSLTTHPAPDGLNRLVFFGASSGLYPNMPDFDPFLGNGQTNHQTDVFVSGVIEPISAAWCPPDPADSNHTLQCPMKEGTLRVADPGTLFALEKLGFYNYLEPLVTAFANASCTMAEGPECGEMLFIRAIEIFNKHWPGKDHGPECEKSGDPKKYCSEAGVNTYEPIAADAFRGDVIPALHEFAQVATQVSKVTVSRGPNKGKVLTGADVIEKIAKILFSTDYAASVGMVDRAGNAGTKWVDGTAQPQLTMFTLFADALHKIDTRFATACDGKSGTDLDACKTDVALRQGQWKRARSQLVDEMLAVAGDGPNAKFKDRALPKILAAALKVAREQLNAQCPDRENGTPCTWAKKDFGDKLASTLSGPLFAALMDVQEKLRGDEDARRETERLLAYILTGTGDSLQGTLASLSDILQVLPDDGHITPILNAIAGAVNPEGDKDGVGAADTGLKVLKALTSDEFDRYHVMDRVLPNLVTPIDGGQGLTPIEIIMNTIADVNRIDASSGPTAPLETEDYKAIMGTMKGFMSDNTRGLEQFYTIIKNRPRE